MNVAVTANKSELNGIFALKQEQTMKKRVFSVNKKGLAILLNTAVHHWVVLPLALNLSLNLLLPD